MLRPPRLLAILPVLIAAGGTAQGAHIRAKIVRVGYPASGKDLSAQGFDRFRPGCWTPVLVELNNDDGDLFEGALQARQIDRDGDQIVSTLPVALRGMKEVFIYVPASPPQLQHAFVLRMVGPDGGAIPLFDDDNNPTAEWRPTQEPLPVAPSARVLLDISSPALGGLSQLASDPMLVRELMVSHISAATLPDASPGLQMVDIVVWDNADPSVLRDVSQQRALLEWVQRGGTLVLGVARNWELLSKSDWGALLPVPLSPPVSGQNTSPADGGVRPLAALADVLMGSTQYEFQRPLLYCPVKRSELAQDAIPLLPPGSDLDELNRAETAEGVTPGNAPGSADKSSAQPDPLIFAASRPCGRGRIVLVTAEIERLLAEATNQTNREILLRQILGIRRTTDQSDQSLSSLAQQDAFLPVEIMTGFRVTTGLYFLAAFLFVVLYILIATAGSWNVLQRRGRVHFAWPAFALIAAVASGTSLLAVQVIRGIGNRVQQLCVIDGYAGQDRAVGNCYFGLKTASHVSLDLALPRDLHSAQATADNPGGLFPLPVDPDDFTLSQYSAGARYQAGGPVGQIWNVPIRATLKQFQGIWQGQLPGTLEASLRRLNAGTSQLALDSWMENKLDCDLTDCYLLITGRDLEGGDSQRTASRANQIIVYPIARLPRGKKMVWKDYLIERHREEQKNKPQSGGLAQEFDPSDPAAGTGLLLSMLHSEWLQAAYRVQRNQYDQREPELKLDGKSLLAALMVLSTFDELALDSRGSSWLQSSIERSRGFELDRSNALTRRTALLIGMAGNHAGPARLAHRRAGGVSRDWETIEPSEANTMYRFVIPLGER